MSTSHQNVYGDVSFILKQKVKMLWMSWTEQQLFWSLLALAAGLICWKILHLLSKPKIQGMKPHHDTKQELRGTLYIQKLVLNSCSPSVSTDRFTAWAVTGRM